MTSLGQQRQAIDRARSIGIWMTCISCVFIVGGVVMVLTNWPSLYYLWLVLLGVVNAILGASQLSLAGKRRRIFESENGPNAGKQSPVTSGDDASPRQAD